MLCFELVFCCIMVPVVCSAGGVSEREEPVDTVQPLGTDRGQRPAPENAVQRPHRGHSRVSKDFQEQERQ